MQKYNSLLEARRQQQKQDRESEKEKVCYNLKSSGCVSTG